MKKRRSKVSGKLKKVDDVTMFTPQLPEKKKKKRYKGKPENIKIHLNHCKYDCIRDVATKKEFGF